MRTPIVDQQFIIIINNNNNNNNKHICIAPQRRNVRGAWATVSGSVLVLGRSMRESLREEVSFQPRFKRGYSVTVQNCLWQQVPDGWCCTAESALCDCCLGERSAQRRSGRSSSPIVDVLSVLEQKMEVGRRRRAADLKSQQSHLVVNYLLNGQPVQPVQQRRGVGSFAWRRHCQTLRGSVLSFVG